MPTTPNMNPAQLAIADAHMDNRCANLASDGRSCHCAEEIRDARTAPETETEMDTWAAAVDAADIDSGTPKPEDYAPTAPETDYDRPFYTVPANFNLTALLASVAPEQRSRIDTAYGQAMAYVWGRQDAGESDRDTGYSIAFAAAYALLVHAYVTETIWTLPNIQGAYAEWVRTHGATLIRVTRCAGCHGWFDMSRHTCVMLWTDPDGGPCECSTSAQHAAGCDRHSVEHVVLTGYCTTCGGSHSGLVPAMRWCSTCECYCSTNQEHVCTQYDGDPCATCGNGTVDCQISAPGYGRVRVCKAGHEVALSPTGILSESDVR